MCRSICVLTIVLGLSGTAWEAAAQLGKTHEAAPADLSQYASTTLSNNQLSIRLYLPDADRGYYRGTRFDWSGLISRVDYKGHTFFREFKPQHDPLNHDDICGTAEEFGMTVPPPGYEQAHQGELFMKIGIGVLKRGDESSYQFWKRYELVKAGLWQVNRTRNAIEFTQTLEGPGGCSYSYAKTLRLAADAPVLTISRRLKNTGARTIDTDHYGHNFLRIDNAAAGPDYALEFPFTPRFGDKAQTQGAVEINSKSLMFTKEVWEQAVWTPLDGFSQLADNRIEVVNHRSGASVTITTDRPLLRLVLYSSGGLVCPEPFVKLSIPPGEAQEWATTYTFSADVR